MVLDQIEGVAVDEGSIHFRLEDLIGVSQLGFVELIQMIQVSLLRTQEGTELSKASQAPDDHASSHCASPGDDDAAYELEKTIQLIHGGVFPRTQEYGEAEKGKRKDDEEEESRSCEEEF